MLVECDTAVRSQLTCIYNLVTFHRWSKHMEIFFSFTRLVDFAIYILVKLVTDPYNNKHHLIISDCLDKLAHTALLKAVMAKKVV